MLALILGALLAQAASAPPTAPAMAKPSVVTQPNWLHKPSAEDLMRYYPKAAAEARVEGRAIIHCVVTETGALAGCTVSDETPASQGFGEAALSMAPLFKMRPQTKDGVPVSGGRINIPIRFGIPQEQLPSLALATRCYGFAAAAAERDPSPPETQVAVIGWMFVLTIRSYGEHPRPSEFTQMLSELRTSAAAKLDDPSAKPDRDECAAQLKLTPGVMRDLEAMARQ